MLCLIISLSLIGSGTAQRGSYRNLVVPASVLELPNLPYSSTGLKPHIDSGTLQVHHQGHHKAYCDKTNAALEEWRAQVNACVCIWQSLRDLACRQMIPSLKSP